MKIPNLLLIAGTGTKSGKTSVACRIIKDFKRLGITAIKITPHFHETTAGLVPREENKGCSIYEETEMDSRKDTSRMLRAGALKVFFAKVWDDQLPDVFKKILEYIPPNTPLICESPALRHFAEPGVFVIMASASVIKSKNINNLKELPHVLIQLEDLETIDILPFGFADGKWFYREV